MDLYWTSACDQLLQRDQGYCALLPTLNSISVTPWDLRVNLGYQLQFVAMGTYSEGSTANLTQHVYWASSDTTIVTVSNLDGSEGVATAVGSTHGTATITAALGTVLGSAPLTVNCLYHSNGLGQFFDDCSPRGTPGDASTYSLNMANEAALAWGMGPVTGTGQCHNAGPVTVVYVQTTANTAAAWAYTGSLAGHVSVNLQSNTPLCPLSTDPTWY